MISIAMTSCNGEKFIEEQILSLLNQTEKDIEIIICDDRSDDNTIQIIDRLACKDVRIKLFKNETRLGYAKNFLKALSLCSGEYIFFCDQDDIWLPNKIELCVMAMKKNPNIKLLLSQGYPFYDDVHGKLNINRLEKFEKLSLKKIFAKCSYQGCDMAFTRELAQKVLKYSNDNIIAHDWLVSIVAGVDGSAFYTNSYLMHHRIRNDSTSRTITKTKKEFYQFINNKQIEHMNWCQSINLGMNSWQQKNFKLVFNWFKMRKKVLHEKNKVLAICKYMPVLFITIINRFNLRVTLRDLFSVLKEV